MYPRCYPWTRARRPGTRINACGSPSVVPGSRRARRRPGMTGRVRALGLSEARPSAKSLAFPGPNGPKTKEFPKPCVRCRNCAPSRAPAKARARPSSTRQTGSHSRRRLWRQRRARERPGRRRARFCEAYYSGGSLTSTLFMLDVDGKKTRVIPREVQVDPVTDRPVHVDFMRLDEGARSSLVIPVHFQQPGSLARPEARRRAEHRAPRDRALLPGREHSRIHRGRSRPAWTSATACTSRRSSCPRACKPVIRDRDFTVAHHRRADHRCRRADGRSRRRRRQPRASRAGRRRRRGAGAEGAAPGRGRSAGRRRKAPGRRSASPTRHRKRRSSGRRLPVVASDDRYAASHRRARQSRRELCAPPPQCRLHGGGRDRTRAIAFSAVARALSGRGRAKARSAGARPIC